ncbi:MAG TPA: hypothetical protein VFD38_20425 [Myxococcaceae bacterium]|nr:hypothetical protein [Myxococcaceae bacterium]
MRHSLLLGLSGLGLLLAPSRAEAQWSLRLALEAPLYVHASSNGQSSSFGINDSFQPTIDLIGSYFITWMVGLDVELRTGIAATGTGYARQRTSIGPGLTFDAPAFPLYGRFSFPIQVEETVIAFVRGGGGLKILDMAFFRIYFEVTADFPLGGSGVGFFSSQAVNAGLGLWLRL